MSKLIHIRPSLLEENFGTTIVEFMELNIPQYSIHLIGGEYLRVVQPYPNRNWWVATHKIGRRHTEGIFIQVPKLVPFTVECQWKVRYPFARTRKAIHKTEYSISNKRHPAITDIYKVVPMVLRPGVKLGKFCETDWEAVEYCESEECWIVHGQSTCRVRTVPLKQALDPDKNSISGRLPKKADAFIAPIAAGGA